MARQSMNKKNVAKYSKKYNLPIVHVLVRGGTDHRKDFCLEDGSIVHLHNNETMEKADIRWKK